MKRRNFLLVVCAILGFSLSKDIKLAKIYPSVIMPGPDNNVNCLSLIHNQRIDGAWCSNRRILAQIKYWMKNYEYI